MRLFPAVKQPELKGYVPTWENQMNLIGKWQQLWKEGIYKWTCKESNSKFLVQNAYTTQNKKPNDRLPVIITSCNLLSRLTEIKQHLKGGFKIVQSFNHRKTFLQTPPVVTFKHPTNIKHLSSSSSQASPPKPKCPIFLRVPFSAKGLDAKHVKMQPPKQCLNNSANKAELKIQGHYTGNVIY